MCRTVDNVVPNYRFLIEPEGTCKYIIVLLNGYITKMKMNIIRGVKNIVAIGAELLS